MKEILCFGDSNTYGLIPGTKERYGRDTRWTGLLEQHLYEKGYRIIEEVKEMNQLTSDTIHAGEYLTVSYSSNEFK